MNNNNFIPENNNMNRQVVGKPYSIGFLCGLFLIIGIFAGILYTGEERHKFLDGWKTGFFVLIFVSIAVVFAFKFAI